jgi:hypothetical protein
VSARRRWSRGAIRTNVPRQLMRPVRRGQIGGDGLDASVGLADLCDDGHRLRPTAAAMDEDLRTRLGKRESAGAADARDAPVTRAVFPESEL